MVQTVAQETQAELDAVEAHVQQELWKLSAQVLHLTALLEAQGNSGSRTAESACSRAGTGALARSAPLD
ncbi:hypothetical protein [Arthrobacter sp. ov118]|uniref:hypothetical protein n=1 Tax=Arthrobacter sp. ov118 TaxID=1761747 RepID=UPI000B853485|nr:hypothetical protein [Arthrobacter sp. ov118]